MSLLLDALKKAAKDKEVSSAATANALASNRKSNEKASADDDLELSLDDDIAVSQDEHQQKTEETAPHITEQRLTFDSDPASNPVSDEALQVLIYKTNHAHKRKRRIIWSSAMAVSALILVASGLYFFKQIQQSITTLETRHRVNMRAIESEPVKTTKLQLAIKTNTGVAGAKADLHPLAKTHVKSLNSKTSVQKRPDVKKGRHVVNGPTRITAVNKQSTESRISVARGEKKDPVNTLLSKAWAAYNASDYVRASNLYAQVLDREKNNRDALMGMGAIALKKNDTKTALDYYNKLLQLDPRDPVANAAILNMNNSSGEDAQSEGRLLYLLQLEPNAAHLYYALGNKYASQSKWPEAEAAYFNAFKHDDNSADYAYNLAVSLERIGRSKEAVKYYKSALQLARNSNISFSVDVVKKRLEQIQP